MRHISLAPSASTARITPSALDLIGHTPLLALGRIHRGPGRILAKAEFMQSGGSVKDWVARAIVLAARGRDYQSQSTATSYRARATEAFPRTGMAI